MSVNIEYLNQCFFTFDLPVPYHLKCGYTLLISPVLLKDYFLFVSSYNILTIDKNSSNCIEDIQMSYLKYLITKVLVDDIAKQKLVNICLLCLGMKYPDIYIDENNRPFLVDLGNEDKIVISQKEFDDIKRIVLYQNLINYDDEYINPELKQAMEEQDALKNAGYEMPSLERQISIITSHCGLSKNEQSQMTLRSHSNLFKEVNEEIEYMVTKPIAIYAGKGEQVQWIYHKRKGKFDDYITSVEKYRNSMGDGIKPTT